MNYNELFKTIDGLNDFYCDIWEKVCNIESPTTYKKGVDEVGKVFIDMANERGWDIEVLEHPVAGNAICITMNNQSTEQSVVLSGHIDTVHPLGIFGTPAVRRDDKCIYGPGVLDCKGGVVAGFMAMDALQKLEYTFRPVKLIIQTDEEVGSSLSNLKTIEFMCKKAKDAIGFLNLEPMVDDFPVLQRKGAMRYKFKVFGKSAHAADCTNGSNAIVEAAHKIIKLEKYKDKNGITCNCGIISGGTAENTVADKCEFSADFRFTKQSELGEIIKAAKEIADENVIDGCTCEITELTRLPAMDLCDRNINLFNKMNDAFEKAGLSKLSYKSALGASDAAHITSVGIPCVDRVGVNGNNLHSTKEFAYLASLSANVKRLAVVISDL